MTVERGFPIPLEMRDLELYRLAAAVVASRRLRALKTRLPPLNDLRATFEQYEVAHRLVALAVVIRNGYETSSQVSRTPQGQLENVFAKVARECVGRLFADVSLRARSQPLPFLEACNKVIHAEGIDLTASRDRHAPIASTITLYGTKPDYRTKSETEWRARLDLLRFIDVAHRLPFP